jgi:hypothetical protein
LSLCPIDEVAGRAIVRLISGSRSDGNHNWWILEGSINVRDVDASKLPGGCLVLDECNSFIMNFMLPGS